MLPKDNQIITKQFLYIKTICLLAQIVTNLFGYLESKFVAKKFQKSPNMGTLVPTEAAEVRQIVVKGKNCQ